MYHQLILTTILILFGCSVSFFVSFSVSFSVSFRFSPVPTYLYFYSRF